LISTFVSDATAIVVTVKFADVPPAGIVTLAGRDAEGELLLRFTTTPPAGAALVSVTLPSEELPPTTVAGLTVTDESAAGAGVPCGVNRREVDQFPATPAEFLARTRHQCWIGARSLTVACDAVDVRLRTRGVENVLLSSTWIS
jgi:hypothetical protein